MNSKVCKRLRRQAGKPIKAKYIVGRPPVFGPNVRSRVPGAVMKLASGVPTRLDNCSRKVYKNLKNTVG